MQQAEANRGAAARVLVALGGNAASPAGDPAATIGAAISALAQEVGPLAESSRLYRTPAFPAGSGADFVNAAVALDCALPAEAILAALHRIEARFGRERLRRWGARSLDLDLLAVGDAVLPDAGTWAAWRDLPAERQAREAPDRLILPHPRLQDRGFVLVPLAEIAPEWCHPVTGLSVRQMRDALPPEALAEVQPLRPVATGPGADAPR